MIMGRRSAVMFTQVHRVRYCMNAANGTQHARLNGTSAIVTSIFTPLMNDSFIAQPCYVRRRLLRAPRALAGRRQRHAIRSGEARGSVRGAGEGRVAGRRGRQRGAARLRQRAIERLIGSARGRRMVVSAVAASRAADAVRQEYNAM